MVVTGGASVIQVGLVLVLTAALVGWWSCASNVSDRLRQGGWPGGLQAGRAQRGGRL
ncbi:MAG: hypothetical protein H0T69_11425 [Thermoleophilaceae bacterium]|nr:hypothetical protein [Thermoleophilaceae bacterium]